MDGDNLKPVARAVEEEGRHVVDSVAAHHLPMEEVIVRELASIL